MVFPTAEFEFTQGLTVITGETGAGKSTILAALGLIFGLRAETSWVRNGFDSSTVTAHFLVRENLAITNLCEEYGVPFQEGELIIRRQLHISKPSKAYVNDTPVTAQFLLILSEYLSEICGQFADRQALSPTGFRSLLDNFIVDKTIKTHVLQSFTIFKNIQKQYEDEKSALASALREQDYLRHVTAELDSLSPEEGEETILAQKRQEMMATEKNMSLLHNLSHQLSSGNSLEDILLQTVKSLSQIEKDFPESLPPIIQEFNLALEHGANAISSLCSFTDNLSYDPDALSITEERLFALRAAARKHHVTTDELYNLHRSMKDKLEKIDCGEALLMKLEKQLKIAEQDFFEKAKILSQKRQEIIPEFEKLIMSHLGDLGMESARFRVRLEESPPQKEGIDTVHFEISTGPDLPFGAIHKTASGGEMSRFMLALKASSVTQDKNVTLIFDEIDRGVGGATADAVGDKLKKLSEKSSQVLVITHSPQVAAQGDKHFHILKHISPTQTYSVVTDLTSEQRREEIARMLSGASITNEARQAADRLLEKV